MTHPDVAVIILAAGKGTRMGDIAINKTALALADGKPMIRSAVDTIHAVDCKQIVVVVGHMAESVQRVLHDYQIDYAVQAEQQGTAHAVKCALSVLNQSVSYVVVVNGDDSSRYKPDIYHDLIKKVPYKGLYLPFINRFMFTVTPTGRGVVVNMLRAHNVNGLNSSSLSKATQELYLNILPLTQFFKKNIPGFSNCYVCDSEPELQLRETSRIEGEYTLTLDDILEKRCFPDTIAYGGYFIDVHHGTDSEGTWKLTEGAYGIPFRCLVPQGAENILAAGRIISGTREAAGSYRVMATCMAMGQAAGTAVSIALNKGIPLREIEATDLRNALKEDNALVDL